MLPEGEALTDLTDRVVALVLLLHLRAVVDDRAGVAQPPGEIRPKPYH